MKDHKLKISVVTAVLNRVETIEQSILSVINQSYEGVEYIVIDGGSTDGTLEVLKKYKEEIDVLISEPDSGIYNAMMKGINLATGDFIQIIGADDSLINDNIIERVVDFIEDDVDILSGSRIMVNEETKLERIQRNTNARGGYDEKFSEMVPTEGLLVRKKLYQKYPFDESYRIVADHKFFLQCYHDKSVKIKYIDMPLAYFSMGGLSSSEKQNSMIINEDSRICKELQLPYVCNNSKLKNKIYRLIKSISEDLRMKIDLYKGWNPHKCKKNYCRWCSNKY